jgi:peptide/nickel transport system permease protein
VKTLARRLAFYLLAAVIAITIDFFIPRMVPGNAVAAQLANLHGTITPATLKGLYEEFGLTGHQSAWDQYLHYWGQLLHGNLGISTSFYPSTVSSVIGGGIFWTLGLVGIATVISFVLGTALGIVVAWRRGSFLDNVLPALTFSRRLRTSSWRFCWSPSWVPACTGSRSLAATRSPLSRPGT